MSDIKGASSRFTLEQLEDECAAIAEAVEEQLCATEEDPEVISWHHQMGVAFQLLRRGLQIPSVPEKDFAWAHSRLIVLHDAMHAYMEGGPDAVQAFYEELAKGEQAPSSGHPLH